MAQRWFNVVSAATTRGPRPSSLSEASANNRQLAPWKNTENIRKIYGFFWGVRFWPILVKTCQK